MNPAVFDLQQTHALISHAPTVGDTARIEQQQIPQPLTTGHVCMTEDQAVQRRSGEFRQNPFDDAGRSTPAVDQADTQATDMYYPLWRSFARSRIHIAAYRVNRGWQKRREQSWGNDISGVKDHRGPQEMPRCEPGEKTVILRSAGEMGISDHAYPDRCRRGIGHFAHLPLLAPSLLSVNSLISLDAKANTGMFETVRQAGRRTGVKTVFSLDNVPPAGLSIVFIHAKKIYY